MDTGRNDREKGNRKNMLGKSSSAWLSMGVRKGGVKDGTVKEAGAKS